MDAGPCKCAPTTEGGFFVTGDVQFGLGAGSKGGLLYRDNQELLNMSSEP